MEKVNNNSEAINASKIEIQKVIDILDNAINNLADANEFLTEEEHQTFIHILQDHVRRTQKKN